MKVEMMALWCVLKVFSVFGIDDLQIYGYSRVTIKWARGEYNLKFVSLIHWCKRIKTI